MEPNRDCKGMGQNLDVLLLKKVTVTLALWALLCFGIFCFPSTINDITYLITSNNRMADDVDAILCMVIG